MNKKAFALAMTRLAIGIPKYAPPMDSRETLAVWYEDLKDLDAAAFMSACEVARKTLTEFPSIAWFIRTCSGSSLDPSSVGEDTAERIEAAIARFGYPHWEAAKDFIGELGWAIVQDHGGWVRLCDITNDEMISSRKMWRDSAKNRYIKLHSTGANNGINLPARQSDLLLRIEL